MKKVLIALTLTAVCLWSEMAPAQGAKKAVTPAPTIARVPVQSQSITSVGYHRHAKILEIKFHDRSIYQYFGVSMSIYKKLLHAESKGRFFEHEIRGHYTYLRVQ